jgi:hypothetical protein
VLLFLAQPLGVHRLGGVFAPIVIIWLLFNLSCGIYNIVNYDQTVLKAFSPHFAFDFFVRNKEEGWRTLGGLLLAFTGVEALFADLGAFSKRAIQLSWLFFAFPCLLLAYIGQAAYISHDTTELAFTNPFFNTVIPGTFYFGLVLAILAASKSFLSALNLILLMPCSSCCVSSIDHSLVPAVGSSDEAIILSSYQDSPYLEAIPLPSVYAIRQLAAHDWMCGCDGGL